MEWRAVRITCRRWRLVCVARKKFVIIEVPIGKWRGALICRAPAGQARRTSTVRGCLHASVRGCWCCYDGLQAMQWGVLPSNAAALHWKSWRPT